VSYFALVKEGVTVGSNHLNYFSATVGKVYLDLDGIDLAGSPGGSTPAGQNTGKLPKYE